MALIPFRPFEDLEKYFEDENWMPVFLREGVKPAMDIYEKDGNIIAEINAPGADPEKIDISVEDNVLRVRGETEEQKEEKEKGYWKKEIRRGSFERAVRLPSRVEKDEIEATYEKGVLKITIPKKEEEKKEEKKIKINIK